MSVQKTTGHKCLLENKKSLRLQAFLFGILYVWQQQRVKKEKL
jgi:hypothetical protein